MSSKVGWGIHGQTQISLLRTTDGGKTWKTVTPTGVLMRHHGTDFISGTDAWIAASPNIQSGITMVMNTTDGGLQWTKHQLPDVGASARVDFLTNSDGWVLLGFGVSAGHAPAMLLETTDGGAKWMVLGDMRYGASPKLAILPHYAGADDVSFSTSQNGWITNSTVDNSGALQFYATHDGGRHWAPQNLPGLRSLPAGATVATPPTFFPSETGAFFVCVGLGDSLADRQSVVQYYETHNGGQTWVPGTTVKINGPTDCGSSVGFSDASDGWVAGRTNLYTTSNAGRTWKTVQPNINLGTTLKTLDFVGIHGWAIGHSSFPRLWVSSNGGSTWAVLS